MTTFRLFSVSVAFLFGSMAFSANFDSNVPKDIQQQMTSDLTFMAQIQGQSASKLHNEIFGQMEGTNYVDFFDTRVSAIGLHTCGSANAVACVIPFLNPSKMWITQNYIKFSHPEIARLMVVYHESRHTEVKNRNWMHATCPTPFVDERGGERRSIWTGAPLAGEPACDSTPYGSYGSSTILLKSISKFCSNCNEKVKADAALYAGDQVNRVTDAAAKKAIYDDLFAN